VARLLHPRWFDAQGQVVDTNGTGRTYRGAVYRVPEAEPNLIWGLTSYILNYLLSRLAQKTPE